MSGSEGYPSILPLSCQVQGLVSIYKIVRSHQSTYRGRVEIGGMYHVSALSAVHHNFVHDGR